MTPVVAGGRASGVVTFKTFGCDYFIVRSGSGDYAVLEWYGGWEADRGDQVAGDWSHYGMTDIYNVSAGASETVWVEDYWLSQARAFQVLNEHC